MRLTYKGISRLRCSIIYLVFHLSFMIFTLAVRQVKPHVSTSTVYISVSTVYISASTVYTYTYILLYRYKYSMYNTTTTVATVTVQITYKYSMYILIYTLCTKVSLPVFIKSIKSIKPSTSTVCTTVAYSDEQDPKKHVTRIMETSTTFMHSMYSHEIRSQ